MSFDGCRAGLSRHSKWFSVFRQFYVGAETDESLWLKRMDRDHCLRLDLADKLDDVVGVDMTAGVDFDQIASHFIEFRFCRLPFLLFQVEP